MLDALTLQGKVELDTSAAQTAAMSFSSSLLDIGKTAAGVALGGAITKAPGFLLDAAKAAAADSASMDRLKQAVSNTAGGWDAHSTAIEKAITQGQNLAFSDDDTRAALSLLTAQTGDADEAMRRLGLAQDLARGAGIPLEQAAKLLGKTSDENTSSLSKLGIQLGKNASAQDVLNAVDAKFGGQAGTFAASDAGKFAIMQDKVGELQEAFGAKLLPVLALGTTAAVAMVNAISAGLDPAFSALSAVIAPVASFIGDHLIPSLILIVPLLAGAAVVIGTALVGAFVTWAAATWAQVAAMLALNTSMLPIIAVLIAVGAAAVLLYEAWTHNLFGIQEITHAVFDFVGPYIMTALTAIQTAFTAVLGAIQTAWNAVFPPLQTIVEAIFPVISQIVQTSLGLVVTIFNGLLAAGQAVFPVVATIVGAAVDSVVAYIQTVITVVGDVVSLVSDLLSGDWSAAWADAKQLVLDVVDGVVAVFSGLPATLLGYAADIASGILGALTALPGEAGQLFLDLASSAGEALGGLVSDAATKAGEILSGIVSGLASLPADAGQAFLDLATDAGTALLGLVTDAGTKAGEILSAIVTGLATLAVDGAKAFIDLETEGLRILANLVIEVGTKAGEIITSLVSPLIEGYTQVVGAVQGLKDGAIGVFSDAATWLTSAGWDVIQGLYNGVVDAIAQLNPVGLVEGIGKDIADALNPFSGSPWPSMIHHGEDVVAGLVTGIQSGTAQVKTAVVSLGQLILTSVNDTINAGHTWLTATAEQIADSIVTGLQTGTPRAIQAAVHMADDVALAMADKLAEAKSKLYLARLAGASDEDIVALKLQLNTAKSALVAWANDLGVTVTEALDMAKQGPLITQSWLDLLGNIDSIISGQAQQQLQDSLTKLQQELTIALAQGAPQAVVDALNASISGVEDQLEQVGEVFTTAVANGMVDPAVVAKLSGAADKVAQIPLDKLKATLPKLKDFGTSLIGQIVDGISAGSVDLVGALDLLNGIVAASMSDLDKTNDLAVTDIIAKLQELEGELTADLADAFIKGTDPTAIAGNLATLEALIAALQGPLAGTNQRLAEMGGYLNQIAMAVGNIASGAKSLYDALNNLSPSAPYSGGNPYGSGTPFKGAPPTAAPSAAAPALTSGPTMLQLYLSPDQRTPLATWVVDTVGQLITSQGNLRPPAVGGSLGR